MPECCVLCGKCGRGCGCVCGCGCGCGCGCVRTRHRRRSRVSSLVQLGRQIEALESATGELRRAKQTVDGRLAEAMEAQARTESELEAVAGDKAKLVRHSPVVFLFATRLIVCVCVCVVCMCVWL